MPTSDEIKRLQERLNQQGYTDAAGNKLVVDGIMGEKTRYAQAQLNNATAKSAYGNSPEEGIIYGRGEYDPVRGIYTTKTDLAAPVGNYGSEGLQAFRPGSPNVSISGNTISMNGQPYSRISSPASALQNRLSSLRAPAPYSMYSNPQVAGIYQQLQALLTKPLGGVEESPYYQSEKKRLEKSSREAATRAVQNMAARGILRSKMTEDALNRNTENLVDTLEGQVAPRAQALMQTERNTQAGMLQNLLNQAQQMAQYEQQQQQQQFQNDLSLYNLEESARRYEVEQGKAGKFDDLKRKDMEAGIALKNAQVKKALQPTGGSGRPPSYSTQRKDALLLRISQVGFNGLSDFEKDEARAIGMVPDLPQTEGVSDAQIAQMVEAEIRNEDARRRKESEDALTAVERKILRQALTDEFTQAYGRRPAGANSTQSIVNKYLNK